MKVSRTAGPTRARRTMLALLLSFVTAFTVLMAPSTATAEPPDEGGSKSLYDKLDEANRAWYEAKTILDESRARQAELNQQIDALTTEVNGLADDVSQLAAEAYTNGGPLELTAALDSDGFTILVDKLSILNQLSWQSDHKIEQLKTRRGDLNEQRGQLDEEVARAEQAEQDMAKQRDEAMVALEAVNGHPSMGFIKSGKPAATPAPRNDGGSFSGESCSEADPTGGSCLTPRTAHQLAEARKVGFDRYAGCFRPADWGEHGKGRACDMAVQSNGFGGEATGEDKGYGNQLAAWYVENAEALGVMYVIWFRQSWMISTGWTNYSGGNDPSAAHTNHVHVSML